MKTTVRMIKRDVLVRWIEADWMPQHPQQDLFTALATLNCVNDTILARYKPDFALPEDFRYVGKEPMPCPVAARIETQTRTGAPVYRSGAFVYRFESSTTEASVEVLVVAAYYKDQGHLLALACLPRAFNKVWNAFTYECDRLSGAFDPRPEVTIIGGNALSFRPTVHWDDIVLPEKLKQDILGDVESFFTKGVDVYKRLKLKPFRKLLLAGVPGTGKTMLCSALAKWALERRYLVIYVSSADPAGATFNKVEQAVAIASHSHLPTMILLEELDAYLHAQQKALVLNILDGAESLINQRGTLLVATTNYPEAIDERVLKRPGRLDRIFVIPEMKTEHDAEQMLRRYLGDLWQEQHGTVAAQLVGYPGAFIREVAVYALTQVAYEDLAELPLDLLQHSLDSLKDQIDEKDNLILRNFGQAVSTNGSA